jgi:tRNA-Thr(GGU) m(6)t(6)A37 methyltransferase TsaA
MHKASFKTLKVQPIYYTEKLRGVFATRHPDRPNPIGITVVELLERKEHILKVKGIDMLDGTPILDIKPYTKGYQKEPTKLGWLSEKADAYDTSKRH